MTSSIVFSSRNMPAWAKSGLLRFLGHETWMVPCGRAWGRSTCAPRRKGDEKGWAQKVFLDKCFFRRTRSVWRVLNKNAGADCPEQLGSGVDDGRPFPLGFRLSPHLSRSKFNVVESGFHELEAEEFV